MGSAVGVGSAEVAGWLEPHPQVVKGTTNRLANDIGIAPARARRSPHYALTRSPRMIRLPICWAKSSRGTLATDWG